jgi:hypothetical protein
VVLPPNGFLIEGPAFVAFHARRWQGLSYDAPPLFTLRAVGGLSLATAPRARVFHGFGDPRIRWAGRELTVEREAVVSRRQEK